MNNYELQQYFLSAIKEFAISNPEREIDRNFIYTYLMGFNIDNSQLPYANIENKFSDWENRYSKNPKINVFRIRERKHFLWFTNGNINGNEIKLYIPLGINHITEGANQIFDYIAESNIEHQSKIADKIRNDNIVVRVNKMEDAINIINFVNSNTYLKEGLLKVNPFLPNIGSVGIVMDNNFSYNSTLCSLISDFLNILKKSNRLDLFNVNEFNKYVKGAINNVQDLDKRDIYSLISKTTTPNFEIKEFIDHANNKLIDKYDNNRIRISSPNFYFEQAIKSTNSLYPQNVNMAILSYLKGNANYFTNRERSREGLLKYVKPGDLISIMRSKLVENNISIPNKDFELIHRYVDLVLERSNVLNENEYNKNNLSQEAENSFNILVDAYINTLNKYNEEQAKYALKKLIQENEIMYFTNDKNDRNKLKEIIKKTNILKEILNNIDITNLEINDTTEVVNRFVDKIKVRIKFKK